MKLTSAQVERTLGQIEARAIPDDHPVVSQLNDFFGEHTFSTATGSISWSRWNRRKRGSSLPKS